MPAVKLFRGCFVIFLMTWFVVVGSSGLQAAWYEGDKIGYIDNVTLNGRDFESLHNRNIEFFKEDLQGGQVIIRGILESESKETPVDRLFVEISTDGGSSWQRASGHRSWEYRFSPKTDQRYNLSLRVVGGLSRAERQQQLRDQLAPVYRSALREIIDRIATVIDSEEFIKGDVDKFKDDIDAILLDLAAAGINLGRGSGEIANMPGDMGDIGDIPAGKTAADFDIGGFGGLVSAIKDRNAHYGWGRGAGNENSTPAGLGGADRMAGRFGQEAWNQACSDWNYYRSTGNGDLYGRDPKRKMQAEACQKEAERLAGKESDFLKATGTDSPTTASPKLKGDAKLGNNKYPSGGGYSEDPADSGHARTPMSAKDKARAEKLLKNKKTHGISGVQGQAGGGDDDARGDTGDDQGEEGEMQLQPGLAGGTDDPRLQNNNSHGGGAVRVINRVQAGGGTGAGEHR